VQQVDIDVVGLQLLELLVEKPVTVLEFLDQPAGKLGRHPDLFPVAVPERLTDDTLAVLAVIVVRRVR
jgi:hypothetical protein